MDTITVRRPAFEWPSDLPVLPLPNDPSRSCELVALSFTLPYLEPYLIRTMRVASKEDIDVDLLAEMKAFSGQEAQHHKNHSRVNDVVRSKLSPEAAAAMRVLEDALEADYRKFSAERSLAFNLAYAEGFEAMTFAFARSVLRLADLDDAVPAWSGLIAWHLAEEIEHRSVTFDAHEAIVGRYPQRIAVASYAQVHFLGYLFKMAKVLQNDTIDSDVGLRQVLMQGAKRHWKNGVIAGVFQTLSPRYNPRDVAIPDDVISIAALQGVDLS